MKYCKQCKIQILDQTSVCPFCRSVLEKEDEEQTEPMYPQVSIPQKKYRFLMRISQEQIMRILQADRNNGRKKGRRT